MERIKSEIIAEGFQIREIKHIGHHLYDHVLNTMFKIGKIRLKKEIIDYVMIRAAPASS